MNIVDKLILPSIYEHHRNVGGLFGIVRHVSMDKPEDAERYKYEPTCNQNDILLYNYIEKDEAFRNRLVDRLRNPAR